MGTGIFSFLFCWENGLVINSIGSQRYYHWEEDLKMKLENDGILLSIRRQRDVNVTLTFYKRCFSISN